MNNRTDTPESEKDTGQSHIGKTEENNFIVNMENQTKKFSYPKSVPFIISNEFCERFNYYGLRTILVIYLVRQLGYSDDSATVIFHIFSMFVYFLCIFGAIISDSWLGKFKTILYLSLVYVCGSVLVALGAVPTLSLPPTTFTMLGLALVALGSGGIKPCVSAFGGDQFVLPEQLKQMTSFFSLFYFSINAGSLISTTITPILREDVQCFGQKECYTLAFGVPAILMALSIVIFMLGRPLYKTKPPAGNMVVLVTKTISNAIATKWKEGKKNPREHWLDYADQKFDKQLISDVKVLTRVLLLYLPLPLFWALFDQQGSRWTLQATRMDGNMGSWTIKPDQLQLLNPLLILAFIPLYELVFYPVLSLIGIRRPLQKLALGGMLAAVAFILSGIVELNLEKTYPTLPTKNNAQLRILNSALCDYSFTTNLPGRNNFVVPSIGLYEDKNISLPSGQMTFFYTISSANPECPDYEDGMETLRAENAYAMFLNPQLQNTEWLKDTVKKPSSKCIARIIADVPPTSVITLQRKQSTDYKGNPNTTTLIEISSGSYVIFVDNIEIGDVLFKTGGVYNVLIYKTASSQYNVKSFTITEPNSLNILWLIPQYVVITLGEVMFSVTGLEFSYSQAPTSMKSVLQACWLLTVAVGNVIVVIVAELSLFDSQASEFFLFAGLMVVDMLVFMLLAKYFKPNNPIKTDT